MPRPKRTKTTTAPRPLSTSTNAANLSHKSRDEAIGYQGATVQAVHLQKPIMQNSDDHVPIMSRALQTETENLSQLPLTSQRRSRTAQEIDGAAERSAIDRAKQSNSRKAATRNLSEATNQEEVLVEGPFSSVTKTDGHISGRVSALSPPPAKSMLGFEEHMQTSSPRPAQPPPGSRAQATPSFLQMSGFKRRARQPSLLQMVQQRDAVDEPKSGNSDIDDSIRRGMDSSPPSEEGDGLRESSASRKRKAAELEEDSENVPPSSPPIVTPSESSPAVLEETLQEDVVQVPATQRDNIQIFEDADKDARDESALRSRSSRSQAASCSSQHTTCPSPNLPRRSTDRIRSSFSPPLQPNTEPELPLPVQSKSRRPARPPIRHRTIKPKHAPPTQRSPSPAMTATPPLSSSDPPTPAQPRVPSPQHRKPAHSQVKVTHRRSDGKSIPPPPASEARKAIEAPITTETLRALLPRRRTRLPPNEDPFEMRSSSPAAHLSLDVSSTSPARPAARKRQPLKGKSANVNVKTKPTRSPAAKKKGAAASKLAGAKKGQTYGARRGQENTVDADADGDEGGVGGGSEDGHEEGETALAEAAKSTEIVQAVKKFKEVDEWELSFESCDVHGGSSSPWR